MADFSSNVKQKFNLLLSQMSENRWIYVNHPQSDFTRQDTGKLTFSDTMRFNAIQLDVRENVRFVIEFFQKYQKSYL